MSRLFQKEFFTKLLLLFIILQPILDILTYLSLRTFNISLTVGIIVRILFMGISIWFILFGNSSKFKKYVIGYLIMMAVVFGIGLIYNYFAKPIFNPFLELQFLAKTVYFSVMLAAYLLLFTTLEEISSVRMEILKAIYIGMLIVSTTMFLAVLTGTASQTYEWNKFGFKGWFYSGNELGSIVAISFPLVYLYTLKKVESIRKSYYFIPLVMLAIVSILLGTKVGYFAVLGAAIIVFASYFVYWIIHFFKQIKEPLIHLRLISSFIFLVLLLVVAPFSPAFTNVSGDVGQINEERESTQQEESQNGGETGEESGEETGDGETVGGNDAAAALGEQALMESPILQIILSSRNIYFSHIYGMYEDAGPVQKLLGMGYAGNYEEIRKLIEMDFFDLFFSYGILGIALILVPFLIIIGLFMRLLFKVPGKMLHPENILILLSIGFGTGIAFLAGHVLYAPAVSIYLAVSIVLLMINMLKMNRETREA